MIIGAIGAGAADERTLNSAEIMRWLLRSDGEARHRVTYMEELRV
jgi:hypothetical protein